MQRKKASDFDQGLLNLFDKYVHGIIDRRGFLSAATKFAAGGVTAAMLLDELSPKFAEAQQSAFADSFCRERSAHPMQGGRRTSPPSKPTT